MIDRTELFQSISKATNLRAALEKSRTKYDGYDFDYHFYSDVQKTEEAETLAENNLEKFIYDVVRRMSGNEQDG